MTEEERKLFFEDAEKTNLRNGKISVME